MSTKLGVTENFVSLLYLLLIQSSTLKSVLSTVLTALATLLHVYIYIYIYIYIQNSLSTVETSEDVCSFNATDLFRMAKYGHTHQAI